VTTNQVISAATRGGAAARDGMQPVRVDAESPGEEIGRDGVMLAEEQEPVDVARAEPDRPSIVSS
jgi:hypothetical protein